MGEGEEKKEKKKKEKGEVTEKTQLCLDTNEDRVWKLENWDAGRLSAYLLGLEKPFLKLASRSLSLRQEG